MSKSQSKRMKLLVASLAVGSLYFMPVSQAAQQNVNIKFDDSNGQITTSVNGQPGLIVNANGFDWTDPKNTQLDFNDILSAIKVGSGVKGSSVIIGNNNKSTGSGVVSIGSESNAYGSTSVAVGERSSSAHWAVAVGPESHANSEGAVSIGKNTRVTGENSVALGSDISVWNKNSIVIGYKSSTYEDNTVSVGNDKLQRKVVYVADGDIKEGSHDAVTGGQLYNTNETIKKNVEAGKQYVAKTDSHLDILDWKTKTNAQLIGNGVLYNHAKDLTEGINENYRLIEDTAKEAGKHSIVKAQDNNIVVSDKNNDGQHTYTVGLGKNISVNTLNSKYQISVGTANANGTVPFQVNSTGAFYGANGNFNVDKDGNTVIKANADIEGKLDVRTKGEDSVSGISSNGTNAMMMAQGGNGTNYVSVNADQVLLQANEQQASLTNDGLKIYGTADSSKAVVINGKDQTVMGLSNTKWNPDMVYVDRAATEGQLADLQDSIQDNIDTTNAKIEHINHVKTEDGTDYTSVEGNKFYSDGAVSLSNGKFTVNADGSISSQYAGEDHTITANKYYYQVKHGDSTFQVDATGTTFGIGDNITQIQGNTILAGGLNGIKINGSNKTISGLSNTSFDLNTMKGSDKAATEAQVEQAYSKAVEDAGSAAGTVVKEAIGDQDYTKVEGTELKDNMNVTDAIGTVNNKVDAVDEKVGNLGDLHDSIEGDSIVDSINKVDTKIDEKINSVTGDISSVKDKVTAVENKTVDITNDGKGNTTIGGNTIINNNGITMNGTADVTTANGSKLSNLGDTAKLDSDLMKNEKYTSNQTVVGAVNAEADIRRNEVARLDSSVSALGSRVDSLENRMGDVEERIDKVGAMSAAIANLRTMGYDPEAPTEIAVGVGQYKSETGLALGVFHYPNQDFMLSASVSTSGDEVMGGIGATWKLGRKSVAERERISEEKAAEKAAEIKAAAEKAAKDAEVNAQREKHAKLLAQREAAHQDIHQSDAQA